jgi:hypothetical protein
VESGLIIFDTSQLRTLSPTGPVAAILRRIADASGLTLAISSVTEDEYGAHNFRQFEKKINSARTFHKELRQEAPDWRPPEFEYPSPVTLINRHMERVRFMFEVLPLDGSHAIEALRRESFRRRPASVDPAKKGSGARDVAIWLTAVEQSRLAGAAVYLVASDFSAFGENVLHDELRREAAVNNAEVILITSTEDLIAKFATRVDVEIDTESLLGDEAVALAVSRTMVITSVSAAMDTIPVGMGLASGGSSELKDLELIKSERLHAYEVRGELWIAAQGIWRLRQTMRLVGDQPSAGWEVLFEQRLTVLINMYEGDPILKAEVMGWEDGRILDSRRR